MKNEDVEYWELDNSEVLLSDEDGNLIDSITIEALVEYYVEHNVSPS